ncbi:hypothetical protein SAMN05216456_1274 [Devosia crocina]|uniref:Uncharacterized protein n=1 Tax=Devosia crocina TaxID=429728 RepID=A0A1I7N9J5_9HYPH|nr:hypothetical protein [Devosia crocina]SFV31226.1 hypothetical protein SAMN05216456_1274 [Devosia crocina]
MTKEQILDGLIAGRTLIQEEWAIYAEIQAVDELVAENKATATRWEWRPSYQCERRVITAGPAALAVAA